MRYYIQQKNKYEEWKDIYTVDFENLYQAKNAVDDNNFLNMLNSTQYRIINRIDGEEVLIHPFSSEPLKSKFKEVYIKGKQYKLEQFIDVEWRDDGKLQRSYGKIIYIGISDWHNGKRRQKKVHTVKLDNNTWVDLEKIKMRYD